MTALALALAVALVPLGAGAGGVVRVADEVRVDGGELTLGLIAQSDGLDPDQSARLDAVRLGPAAGAGRTRTFAGDALRHEIQRAVPDATVAVPDAVRVQTRARTVTGDEVKTLVERAIRLRSPWPADALRLSAWTVPADFAAPPSATRTELSFQPGEDFVGRVAVELRFCEPDSDDGSALTRSAAVHVAVRQPVVITARALPRGAVLDSDALALEERDLSELAGGASTDLSLVVGRRLARALGAGAVVAPGALEVERVVRRGDLLVVDAGSGALVLTLEARALEPGAVGEQIRAENRESHRELQVEIVAAGHARLALPAVGAAEAAR